MTQPEPVCIYLGFNDPRQHARGTENVIRFQAEAAPGRSYYVFRGSGDEVFRWARLVAISVPRNHLMAAVALRRLMTRLGRRHARVIVHGHSYILSALLGRIDVFTVHDAVTYAKAQQMRRGLWLYRWLERRVYARTSWIHAISRFSWAQMVDNERHVARQVLIPNTTAGEVPPCPPQQPDDTRPRYLLAVRSMEPRAHIELLLELARALSHSEPATRIIVAGKGPLLEHYRRVAREAGLGGIEFAGFVSDDRLHDLYCGADCLVLTALHGEGFGLPLIEAYARGTPAIGSDVCAVPEVIARPDTLFDNTLPSLLQALRVARGVPREAFRQHFESQFGRARILAQYRELYARVA